ncbi:MAG: TlpA family protein disulfide reductase [Anaerolineae bacterium]|nr:TlpA family protein disulfide reductase [Anaerolineae bacterium]
MADRTAKGVMRFVRLIAAAACLIAALVIVASAGLPDRSRANAVYDSPQGAPIAPEVGAVAPPLEAIDLHGKLVSLAALRGTPVVINFWATWCGPCITEMPLIQAAYAQYRAQGLRIIGVDSNETPAEVLNWQAHFDLTYDLVIDQDSRLASAYRVRGLPSTYFIGRDGVMRQIAYGPLTEAGLSAAIADLLR